MKTTVQINLWHVLVHASRIKLARRHAIVNFSLAVMHVHATRIALLVVMSRVTTLCALVQLRHSQQLRQTHMMKAGLYGLSSTETTMSGCIDPVGWDQNRS